MTDDNHNLEVKPRTRFDLEDSILDCWRVVNDIKQWQGLEDKDSAILAAYYEHKFEHLWATFETLIKQGTIQ